MIMKTISILVGDSVVSISEDNAREIFYMLSDYFKMKDQDFLDRKNIIPVCPIDKSEVSNK